MVKHLLCWKETFQFVIDNLVDSKIDKRDI